MQNMNCPGCNKELPASTEENGTLRYYCDCAGFFRPVIEIAAVTGTDPRNTALETPKGAKKK